MLAKQVLHYLSHASSPFCSGYFGDGFLRTICLDWPRTTMLPYSASQVAGITGVSYCIQMLHITLNDEIYLHG
jgi:hypothetical protein